LTSVLGGEYWKYYLLDERLSSNQQIEKVMLKYKKLLQKHLPFVGYCPVFETTPHSILKYYIFFASRHTDAALLMNDIMFRAYWSHIWNVTVKGTLFDSEGVDFVLPKNYILSLQKKIILYLKSKALKRIELWKYIVSNNFMRYSSSHFKKEISKLNKEEKITYIDTRGTNRLNDDSIIQLT